MPAIAALALAAVLALMACDRRESKSSNPMLLSTAGPARTGSGVIRGIVTLAGRAPEMPIIANQPCHPGAKSLQDETVATDADGHLENVVVYLESPPPAPPAPAPPIRVLDQINCHYIPHVIALRTGQALRISSSDPTFHNVHGMSLDNPPFNFALISAGQSKQISFTKPEAFIVRCDVHPWMKAYIHVFDHPYFAVTGMDGSFQISNVPSGDYTLVAWQEKYGKLRQHVTIADDKVCTLGFVFQSGL